jgi:hypothetical protein
MALATVAALDGGTARADSGDHPDFMWWPTANTGSSRLYVGNLAWGSGGAAEENPFRFNPTELSVDKQVP